MSFARTYRMTVASVWYDEVDSLVKEYEMHFVAALKGDLRETRKELAMRGVLYFQRQAGKEFNVYIPEERIRVAFEREHLAEKSSEKVTVYVRRMEGVGKQRRWRAYPERTRVVSWRKKDEKTR